MTSKLHEIARDLRFLADIFERADNHDEAARLRFNACELTIRYMLRSDTDSSQHQVAMKKYEEKIVYLNELVIPPLGWVRVPQQLATVVHGKVAYFTWPISQETIDDAVYYPNSDAARKIRALSFE